MSITMFGIAISAMILLSFLPLATGGFRVDLPQQKDINWTYSEGMLTFSAPVGISNGGVYDITHLTVNSTVENSTGCRLADEMTEWGTVPAGSHMVRNYSFSLDLVGIVDKGGEWLLFNPDSFSINLNISAKYTLDLVGFTAGYAMSFPWEGLMHGVTFGIPRMAEAPETLSVQMNSSDDSHDIEIPFHLAASDLLPGFGVNLTVNLVDGAGENLASYSQWIDLGKGSEGVISFTIDSEELLNLTTGDQIPSLEVNIQIPPDMQFTFMVELDLNAISGMIG